MYTLMAGDEIGLFPHDSFKASENDKIQLKWKCNGKDVAHFMRSPNVDFIKHETTCFTLENDYAYQSVIIRFTKTIFVTKSCCLAVFFFRTKTVLNCEQVVVRYYPRDDLVFCLLLPDDSRVYSMPL